METQTSNLNTLLDMWNPPDLGPRDATRHPLVMHHLDDEQFKRLVGHTPMLKRSLHDFGQSDAKGPSFPKWSGKRPAVTLRPWLKSLRLWRQETRMPAFRHGAALRRSFEEKSWMFQCTERIPEEVLMTERNWNLILREILKACKQSLDIEPDILMEQFLFNIKREPSETCPSEV